MDCPGTCRHVQRITAPPTSPPTCPCQVLWDLTERLGQRAAEPDWEPRLGRLGLCLRGSTVRGGVLGSLVDGLLRAVSRLTTLRLDVQGNPHGAAVVPALVGGAGVRLQRLELGLQDVGWTTSEFVSHGLALLTALPGLRRLYVDAQHNAIGATALPRSPEDRRWSRGPGLADVRMDLRHNHHRGAWDPAATPEGMRIVTGGHEAPVAAYRPCVGDAADDEDMVWQGS